MNNPWLSVLAGTHFRNYLAFVPGSFCTYPFFLCPFPFSSVLSLSYLYFCPLSTFPMSLSFPLLLLSSLPAHPSSLIPSVSFLYPLFLKLAKTREQSQFFIFCYIYWVNICFLCLKQIRWNFCTSFSKTEGVHESQWALFCWLMTLDNVNLPHLSQGPWGRKQNFSSVTEMMLIYPHCWLHGKERI